MKLRPLFLAAGLAVLAACSSGRPKERINPPALSIQELRLEEGRCRLHLRLHNHSSVIMRFREVRLGALEVDGRDLAPLVFDADREIPPYSGEPVSREVPCADLAANASELVYRLSGTVSTDQPQKRRFDVEHRSRLLPVPGLPATWR